MATGQAWYDDVSLEEVEDPPTDTRATVTIDARAPAVPYSRMIFGGFLDHFERQIYGGVFEPGSPLSDQNGFRRDVAGISAAGKAAWIIVRGNGNTGSVGRRAPQK